MRILFRKVLLAVVLLSTVVVMVSLRRNPDGQRTEREPRGVASARSNHISFNGTRPDNPQKTPHGRVAAATQGNVESDQETGPRPADRRPLASETIFDDFGRWTEEFLATPEEEANPALAARGERLAVARRAALARLVEVDPEQAIGLAVPMKIRRQLPPSIVSQLEERVSGRARYEVIAVAGTAEEPQLKPAIKRYVTIRDRTYRAFVYGRRLQQPTKENIPLHGIALGDALAVDQSPVRVLEPGEPPDSALATDNRGLCPISQQASASSVAVESGGEIFYLCRTGHIAAFSQKLEQQEMAIGPAVNGVAKAASVNWTKGQKRVLLMRVNFPDALTASISEPDARDLVRKANDFFVANSYGRTSLAGTVTPLLTLSKPSTWYATIPFGDMSLLNDARLAAKDAGFDTADYDLDCVHFRISGLLNQGFVTGKGVWLQTGGVGMLCHELGHNFGLPHANAWLTTDGTVTGAGRNLEYGNVYDTMGGGMAAGYQFNAYYKHLLGWLPDSAVRTITTDGVYRLYPFDAGTMAEGMAYALRIRMDDRRDYWIETRQQLNAEPWPGPCLLVNWGPSNPSGEGSQLLDMTPGSDGGRFDATLLLGQSFLDADSGLEVIPLRLGGTAPESIDVLVRHAGPRLEVRAEPNGDCTIILTDPAGSGWIIEATSDLITWVTVGTVSSTTGKSQITDGTAREYQSRFYRAVAR